MPIASVNGTEIFYSLEGPATRPTLVLSHSLMANHRMWDAQMPALRDYRVLRFDTRGHGASGAPAGPYTLDQLADDGIALIEHLGMRASVWVRPVHGRDDRPDPSAQTARSPARPHPLRHFEPV